MREAQAVADLVQRHGQEVEGARRLRHALQEPVLARVEGQGLRVRLGEGAARPVEAHVARPAPVHRDVGVGAFFWSWIETSRPDAPRTTWQSVVYFIEDALPR